MQNLLFRDVAGQIRTACVGEHDVEEAAVVADVEHRPDPLVRAASPMTVSFTPERKMRRL